MMRRMWILLAGIAALPLLASAELTFGILPDRPDAMYACGEKATFTVTAFATEGVKATEGVVSAALDNFGTQQVATATFDLAKGNPFTVSGTLAEPGFLRLTLAGKGAKRTVQSVGYDPGRIRRGGPRPDDFDAWWDAQVAKLAREVPLDPQVERVPEESTKDFDFYRISFATFGRRVYGFMSVPTDRSKAPYPVRFTVPGAGWGSYSNVMRGDPDAISVFVGVHPFAPGGRGWDTPEMKAKYDAMNAEANAKWGTQYSQAGISASREEYFFYPVILGINRVVDWVAARDDVKASDFTYNGYSQGGGFGFYLTALNRHFTRAVMHVPALADTLGCLAGRASGWPTVIERQREENRAAALRNAPYFDAANFASRITIPVRVAVGFADTTCPPCAVYAAYNAIASKDKAIVHGNAMGHAAGRYRALHDAINAWLVEPPVRAPAPFAAGERVTFFGDSITTHNYFTYHLEFLETLRHPENPMLTISRGHAGDTAKGGFSRWDWDAAPVPSDRVVMMFGMNDVCRDAWKDELPDEQAAARREQALRTYEEYARKLADKILASGRRLTLVTPSPFDQYSRAEPPANLPFCNDPGLASCARIVRALAREKDLDVIDYFTPLTAFLQEHPEFGLLAKDRVHPDCKGGLLMAAIALEQMGVLPFTDETAFDAKGQPTAAFDYRPRHLPYPRTSDYLAVNAAHPLDGRLTREIVRIANLPDGTYELAGEGRPIGSFTAAELAAGVDLARLDTPSMRQAMAAAKAFGERRGHMQLSRRMVSTQVILRRMGVDVSDRAAVDAGIKKRRAEIARTVGGGRNPGMEKYYNGQLEFFEKNRDKVAELEAANDALRAKLVAACQPRAWRLTVTPKKTRAVLFFDTEDYTCDESNDAIRDIATILTEEGVRGNFNIVGFLALRLAELGRRDVVDALKPHVLGTQTLYHSRHPDIAELGDDPDYARAYRDTMRDEAKGLGMLEAVFGEGRIVFACPPGNSVSAVAFDVYSDLGIALNAGTGFYGRPMAGGTYSNGMLVRGGQAVDGLWYFNQYHLPYYNDFQLERLIPREGKDCPDFKKVLDGLAAFDFAGLYMHPHMAVKTAHWDGPNYRGGNLCDWRRWKQVENRPKEVTAGFYRRLRAFVKALKADPRFEVTDLEAIRAAIRPRRVLTAADIPTIRAALRRDFNAIREPASWSVADCFQAAVRLLRGETEYRPGKVYGFLERPRGVTAATAVSAADLRAAARRIDLSGFIPAEIAVGGRAIGPADFLFAALEVLETGADTVTVVPREQLGSFKEVPRLPEMNIAGKWLHTQAFRDRFLSERLRLQLWTLRIE